MALMTPSSKTSQASLVDGLSITACCIGTPVDTDLNAVSDAVPQLPVFNELDVEISTMEIKCTIAAMKNNKSPGSNGIPAELLKCGGAVLVRHCLFRCCWQNKCIPSELKNANIITLYKNKGDKQGCKQLLRHLTP